MAEPSTPTRRARLRAQTLAEIREHALAQIAEAGPEAVSLNAIARAMGMSGPALYRYFASRDELLASLAAEGYDDLAETLARTAAAARRRAPSARFRAVCGAFHEWALAHPHRYRLVFSSRYGSGHVEPEDTIPAAHRVMATLLAALAELGPPVARDHGGPLDRQLERWAGDRGADDAPPAPVLRLGVATWTRLHGLVSLELEGVFASMGLDPALLFASEVDDLVARREGLA